VPTQGLYRDQNASDTSGIASIHWEDFFQDTLLQNLISEAIRQSPDLKIATARIQQAEAYLEQARLAFFPTISANATVQNGKTPNNKTAAGVGSNHLYQLIGSASWEADIWGKLKTSKRAEAASLMQSEAYRRAVQTDLVASIANDYYQLLALDQQLKITQQSVQNWITTVTTMKALKEADVVTGAAVVQSEASRYAAEVTIPDIKQSIRQTENALSVLLGRVPGPIKRSTLANQHVLMNIQTGIPAQLLANRPDVQEAEENFRYYFELTNVARTYFYPSLTITANTGWSATNLNNLFSPSSVVGNIAGGLLQPIFNQGINKTRLKVAQAQQQEAFLNFQKSLLNAGQEVSNSLSLYQAAQEKTSARDSQLVNLQKAVDYTQQLVRYSSANYTEVLTAEQSLLSAELGQVNDQLQKWQAVINLYQALGGGWK
jgi:NodT family efflux transporter outer membrane factor (OMF) lipoprotein